MKKQLLNNHFRTILTGLIVFFLYSGNSILAAESAEPTVYETIMQRIRTSEWNKITNINSLNTEVTGLMSTLQANGSWTDIPYTSREQTNWEPISHLERLKKMTLAYTIDGSGLKGNAGLQQKIEIALRYWQDAHPTSTNWFMQQIGCPQRMGIILILLRTGATQLNSTLEGELIERMKADGGRPDQSGSQGTGANKIAIATHWVYRACLTQNQADLAFGTQQVYYPIYMTTDEGLQHDLSYFQHGQQFYTGGYGASYVGDVANIATFMIGTDYAISGEKLDMLVRFAREAYLRIIRGNYFLYNVLGRGLSRPGSLNQTSFLDVLYKVKALDPDNAAVYDAAEARIKGTQAAGYGFTPALHTHYWRADYSLYTSTGYTFDVRMASTRTLRNENGNGENLKGYFLTDGATTITVDGDEYVDIFPTWEWTRIPGTTTPQKTTIYKPSQWGTPGASIFAGGVSDSICGVTAYHWNDQGNSVNTRAKKSWFVFGNEIVCLGASITSTAAEEVNTTVNQCLLKGDVVASSEGSQSNLSSGSHSFTDNLDWVYHNKVGYIFPEGGALKLTNQQESGSWYPINNYESNETVTKDVFKLWFDHGITPKKADYAYIIVPGKDLNAIKNYNSQHIEILVNSDSVQAVRNKTTGLLGLVFYRSASFSDGNLTVHPDKSCALLIKNAETANIKVHIADVSQANSKIKVRFASPALTKEKELTCTMPVLPYRGSTKVYDVNTSTPDYKAPDKQTLFTLYPDADAYVRGGEPNHGQMEILEIKQDAGNYAREAYIRFDLSGTEFNPDSIKSAKLKLSVHSVGPLASSVTWLFKKVDDNSWNETEILWENRPAAGSVMQAVAGCSSCEEVVVDLRTALVNALKKGETKFSINISGEVAVSGDSWVRFFSRETEDDYYKPQLIVEKGKYDPRPAEDEVAGIKVSTDNNEFWYYIENQGGNESESNYGRGFMLMTSRGNSRGICINPLHNSAPIAEDTVLTNRDYQLWKVVASDIENYYYLVNKVGGSLYFSASSLESGVMGSNFYYTMNNEENRSSIKFPHEAEGGYVQIQRSGSANFLGSNNVNGRFGINDQAGGGLTPFSSYNLPANGFRAWRFIPQEEMEAVYPKISDEETSYWYYLKNRGVKGNDTYLTLQHATATSKAFGTAIKKTDAGEDQDAQLFKFANPEKFTPTVDGFTFNDTTVYAFSIINKKGNKYVSHTDVALTDTEKLWSVRNAPDPANKDYPERLLFKIANRRVIGALTVDTVTGNKAIFGQSYTNTLYYQPSDFWALEAGPLVKESVAGIKVSTDNNEFWYYVDHAGSNDSENGGGRGFTLLTSRGDQKFMITNPIHNNAPIAATSTSTNRDYQLWKVVYDSEEDAYMLVNKIGGYAYLSTTAIETGGIANYYYTVKDDETKRSVLNFVNATGDYVQIQRKGSANFWGANNGSTGARFGISEQAGGGLTPLNTSGLPNNGFRAWRFIPQEELEARIPKFSDDKNTHWYYIRNLGATGSASYVTLTNEAATSNVFSLADQITSQGTAQDAQLFKFVNPVSGTYTEGYAYTYTPVYSFAMINKKGNKYVTNASFNVALSGSEELWTLRNYPYPANTENPDRFIFKQAGRTSSSKSLTVTGNYICFTDAGLANASSNVPESTWAFEDASGSPGTSIDIIHNDGIWVYVEDGYIRVAGSDAPIQVYTTTGTVVNPTKRLLTGIYLVKVSGKVFKVLVK